jgi:ATP-dependent helicase HrpB
MSRLPIDAVLPDVIEELRRRPNLVIEAPPGAGKTTRVPPALLDTVRGQVLVLEPRRLPARLAAKRVAEELGETVGGTVGYQIRFEAVAGPSTRLLYLTEGVLTRRLLSDRTLQGADVVILDEFHERHLEADLALALLRRIQLTRRPELRLLVMSATLDAIPIAQYLDCRVVRSEGRLFPVEVEYAGYSASPLEEQVERAFEAAARDRATGHALVFLPGAAEIRRATTACSSAASRLGWTVLPLHGDLPAEEQDRAVRPSASRKLILSTNVAESSVTIEDVTLVIDSGFARVPFDSPETGLPTLNVQRISKASANQRAGRAGRTAPGRAVRLFSAEDFARRPDTETPEIRRRELSQLLLALIATGGEDELNWFEAPPQESWAAAHQLLERLDTVRHAEALAQLPLHPRLARIVIEAEARHAGHRACRLAAFLSAGERFEHIDVLAALDQESSWRAAQIERQLRRAIRPRQDSSDEESLRIAILAGYPDRVARRRSGREIQMATGKPAVLVEDFSAAFLVALDVEDRREQALPLVRAASRIEPQWLLDLYPERVTERSELQWNRTAERVEEVDSLWYDNVLLDETRRVPLDRTAAGAMVAEKAWEAGLHRFANPDEVEALLARTAFAAEHGAGRALGEDEIRSVLTELAAGLRSLDELKAAAQNGAFTDLLLARALAGASRKDFEAVAPEHLQLGPRKCRIHYARGQAPWIESRLQDFFGMHETPRLGRGTVPLVLHLLAPNGRPVQTTTDLAGFWERLYPQVRRELSRRYPKHQWPEKP